MNSAIDNIYSLKFTLKNTERVDGKLLTGEQLIKYRCNPLMYYVYMLTPNAGSEILYIKGKNNNQAIYNPSTFPYIKLNLDPNGSLMRKNNHHTIFQIGFDYIQKMINAAYSVKPEYFSYTGSIANKTGRYYKIVIDLKDYKVVKYQIKENENIVKIAQRLYLSEYKILELNPQLDFDYTYSKVGASISIPTYYAKKIEIFIDSKSFLPVLQKVYDENGLMEKYEYNNVEVNPKFLDKDFIVSYFDEKK